MNILKKLLSFLPKRKAAEPQYVDVWWGKEIRKARVLYECGDRFDLLIEGIANFTEHKLSTRIVKNNPAGTLEMGCEEWMVILDIESGRRIWSVGWNAGLHICYPRSELIDISEERAKVEEAILNRHLRVPVLLTKP